MEDRKLERGRVQGNIKGGAEQIEVKREKWSGIPGWKVTGSTGGMRERNGANQKEEDEKSHIDVCYLTTQLKTVSV